MQQRKKKILTNSGSPQPLTLTLNDLEAELKHRQTPRNVNCMHVCHAYVSPQNKEYIHIKLPVDG